MVHEVVDGMIPLFAAAAVAYDQVFSLRRTEGITPSVDELDLVAFALSGRLPIYGVRANGGKVTRITGEELMQGMFWGGAMRFELGGALGTVTHLTVSKIDLARVLEFLKRQPLEL